MRLVLEGRQTSKGQDGGAIQTSSYIEMEYPITEEIAMVVYVLPTSHHSAYVGTCWGNLFDLLVTDLRKGSLKKLGSDWPLLARLVQDAVDNKFDNCAFLHLKDPDDGDRKWCLVTSVDGISFNEPSGYFTAETYQALVLARAKSEEMLLELEGNGMNVWGLEGEEILSLEEIRERLGQLDELEEYAQYTLKRLYKPEGPMEYLWWSATWLSGTRAAWRKGATQAVLRIKDEKAKLRLQEARLLTQEGNAK